MFSYAGAVLLGLVAVTVGSVKIYKSLQSKLIRYERYVPRISAAILALMAIVVSVW